MSFSTATTIDTSFLVSQPACCFLIQDLPLELHVNILTYLRAYDLSSVQLLCRFFANPTLTHAIVHHTAHYVYPPELTKGFLLREEEEMTYQALRNMELLVVARVLNRPEPKHGGYYVSKSWCKTALRWLEVQQEQQEQTSSKKKLSKKQQRIKRRRLSDAGPPWQNVNSDIVCTHMNLQKANSKAARSRRKVLDKQAWKVLKKLYPDSIPLELAQGECLLCCVEQETQRKNELDQEEKLKALRKQPLSCPLTRGIYTRSRGVPLSAVVVVGAQPHNNNKKNCCPLQPGLYHVLPRAWCHAWRRYIKQGGEEPGAPNATSLLCDAHRLPLIPPHLESYLCGETEMLLSSCTSAKTAAAAAAADTEQPPATVVGMNPLPPLQQEDHDDDMMRSLYASGMTAAEVASQRMAMMSLQDAHHAPPPQQHNNTTTTLTHGELLDRENKVVVEILTQEEYTALEKWWPSSHCNFSLRFAVLQENTVEWSTVPCRECDASRPHDTMVVRNRVKRWDKKQTLSSKNKKKNVPANLEY